MKKEKKKKRKREIFFFHLGDKKSSNHLLLSLTDHFHNNCMGFSQLSFQRLNTTQKILFSLQIQKNHKYKNKSQTPKPKCRNKLTETTAFFSFTSTVLATLSEAFSLWRTVLACCKSSMSIAFFARDLRAASVF
jgi:hypothetical protein